MLREESFGTAYPCSNSYPIETPMGKSIDRRPTTRDPVGIPEYHARDACFTARSNLDNEPSIIQCPVQREIPLLRRVLIGNRGEIAIRIAKAASALGVESVGVYAPVDAFSLHTRFTTEAREIVARGAKGKDSVGAYLDAGALIRIAKASGCDSVHPGYGFLAENPAFAELCAAEGLVFIGPPPAVLALFGDKIRARSLARSLGIPIVPGSGEALTSPNEASELARELGYPVMLKASAGGGGRGMRVVQNAEAMAEAFARCQSEAQAAFGDGSVFVERLISRPRHVEVQILADAHGNVIHLHERDCSVQLRHQKVVEMAPAPGLDESLREHILEDAIKLASAADYVNAGTVEFLVSPETGEYFFIECNPRIQVEHTVTEQVTGVDLVEAQFQIASGATLAALGLGDQRAVGAPRGFAVEARVVARGAGTISGYKEPSGPGVRVDACAYLGYAPPPDFDPLLAKVIGSSSSTSSLASAVDRTLRALDEFHIAGLPTNLPELRAILLHPDVRAGDARTSLLEEDPEILRAAASSASANGGPLAFLQKQATTLRADSVGRAVSFGAAAGSPMPSLDARDGARAVECPMGGAVVELRVREGDTVAAGDTVLVVSTMKMETLLAAPCSGVVTAVQPLSVGDTVAAGQVVALVAQADGAAERRAPTRSEAGGGTWRGLLEEINTLKRFAHDRLAPGSTDPGVIRQRKRGKLTCRERINLLLDDGSFQEIGSVAGFASYDENGSVTAFTPANHVGGWGKIDGRTAVVCADDFTSRGGHADGAIAAKSMHLDRLSLELRAPCVRMLDGSSGGGSVAAMVPQQKKEGESRAKGEPGRDRARQAAGRGHRRIVLAWAPGQLLLRGAARHRTGGQPVARQRSRHRRRQGRARPLLGDGARHRAALRGRAPRRAARDGVRHHQGGSRRVAHPLPQRFGRQPRGDRGRGGGDDEAVPLVSAVQRLRAAPDLAA